LTCYYNIYKNVIGKLIYKTKQFFLMKKILNFNNFLNEKYQDDPEYRIRQFFTELEKNIRFWFSEGTFAAQDAQLYDIKIETTDNLEKHLMFDFQDTEYYYQMIFIVTLQEVEEDTLDECHIKLKRYDIETSELIREVHEDVEIMELNEDVVLELFTKLDEESDTIIEIEEKEEEEEEFDNTLPDDNTDLENEEEDIF